MKKDHIINAVFVALFLAGIAAIALRSSALSGPIVEPAIFARGLGFEQGLAQARSEGKPLIVIASAQWCGPCRSYLAGALASEPVQQWFGANAVAVHLDVDESSRVASELGVTSIPATILIRNDQVIDRRVGSLSSADLLAWLADTARAPRE